MDSDAQGKLGRVLIADLELAEAARHLAGEFAALELVYPQEPAAVPALPVEDYLGVVTQAAVIDQGFFDAARNLRVVLKLGRNYANIDVAAARQRGLILACSPRKGPNCVAELATTLILALSKDLLISHRSVADGAYRLRGLQPEPTAQWKMAFHWMGNERVNEINRKVLGIVGMGEIGCELARRASVLGMRVVYYKRSPLSPELERQFSAEYRPLEALLAESDYVCLAVPHTPETERMLGAEQLAQMRPTAYLVNICRGGVVDEAALVEVLQRRKIAGAGLDVFTLEPLQAESPLCSLDNVILTPHIGGGTGSNHELELREGLQEMQSILSGRHPQVDLSQPVLL